MKLIGLEEHFVTPDVLTAWEALEPKWQDVAFKQPTAAIPEDDCLTCESDG
jgi:hypothetical protein